MGYGDFSLFDRSFAGLQGPSGTYAEVGELGGRPPAKRCHQEGSP